jgi:2,3-bisphosphoglycerate-dependent phosphoglycerate mutase
MRLYLIRHAQSYNNAIQHARQRVQDPPLTEIGEQQAVLLAHYLQTAQDTPPLSTETAQGFSFTRLYASPMRRTLQTAQPIAHAFNLPIQVWTDIHEWGGIFLEDAQTGEVTGFGGMTRSQIEEAFPEAILPDNVTEKGWWLPSMGRETTEHAIMRAVRVALALRELANTDESIALVTHGGFMDTLLKALLDQLPRLAPDLFYSHANTSITRVDFGRDGMKINPRYHNRFEHLPFDLRTV